MSTAVLQVLSVKKLKLQHVAAPHPAWRRLSKELTSEVRETLATLLGLIH